MDTPERNQIGTPVSKFEDSPIFNYINNLSPIKPVKSHATPTFQSLNFASISAVFASPHISSAEKSKFLRRSYLLGKPKTVLSPDDGGEIKICSRYPDIVHFSDCPAYDGLKSGADGPVDQSTDDQSEQVLKLCKTLKYDCNSPTSVATPCNIIKTSSETELSETPALLMQFVQSSLKESQSSPEAEVKLPEVCQLEHIKDEGPGCDWESLITASDLLIFDASTTPESSRAPDQILGENDNGSIPSGNIQLQADNHNGPPNAQAADTHGSSDLNSQQELPVHYKGDTVGLIKEDHPNLLPCSTKSSHNSTTSNEEIVERVEDCNLGSKVDIQQHRGMLRRCLVFEVGGTHNKKGDDTSTSSQADGKINSDVKPSVPLKPGGVSSSPCIIPGIGLHLNTLATTSKNCRVVKQEILASGKRLISVPKTGGLFTSLSTGQRTLSKLLTLDSIERETGITGKEGHASQDGLAAPGPIVIDDSDQSSPKNKRRRVDNVEPETCKRCNCKKSKCLKLYCECFAAGVYCVEPCSCQDCYNKPIHEDTVLATRKQIESRNPLAFAPKVIRSSEAVPDIGEEHNKTPASARHKRGCNCKKSSCNKKYCECYQGGVGCSSNCRCEGCKNAFGRKDGAILMGIEEHETESDASQKERGDQHLLLTEANKDEPLYPDSHLPSTPFPPRRVPNKLLPFSHGKPPRAAVLPTRTLRKSDVPNFKTRVSNFPLNVEDETPEILRGDCSSPTGFKTVSPNSKRVSPPHSGLGLGCSPGRSSRKLILQSIPSLPALTPLSETANDFSLKFQ